MYYNDINDILKEFYHNFIINKKVKDLDSSIESFGNNISF